MFSIVDASGAFWASRGATTVITNDEVMARSEQMALHDTVATRRRRFVGNILRLSTITPASLVLEIRMDTRR